MDTTGTITSFTSTPNTIFDIGGDSYRVETAGQSYSLTNPDAQTLRFEIRPGDQWTYDAGHAVDRADIDGSANRNAVIPAGTPINLNYQFMLEPNGPNGSFTNTASWFVTGQMHSADWVTGVVTSPPFAIQLDGDHLQVVARYVSPGGDPSNSSSDLHMMTLWTDPNPITTGQYYNISIQSNVSNTGGGYLHVSINGNQIVNYNGPLGFGEPTYWEQGLYRSSTSETVAADYRNLTITTGAAAADPVLPAVTQATASPGTGTEHVGDTVTLTLGFNEAVTVTGTPTLSLNDGATATYVGGSGTSALTFKTTVASTDTNTSALAITGVNLPSGASIKDASGLAANLTGAVKTFSGLQIEPVLPAVTQDTASPATGTEHVGDTVTLTLGFNEAVTVAGTPTLSLNDGATAAYVGGSGTSALTFKTTVASTNTNTSALAVTGVNLPSGASIKDSSGVAANLAGAVTTFSGLQVATSSTTPSTPSVTKPVLTVADPTLTVTGRGGTVDLGAKVTTTDSNDLVTVNITGLPKYETITDRLDGQTFQGKSITLTEAQVDSGLTLQSNYKGAAHPVATLTLTANAKDPATGAVTTASPQTIAVTDPRPATTMTATSPQTTTVTGHPLASAASTEFLANQGFAQQEHVNSVTSTAAATAQQPITVTDHLPATAASTGFLANQGFALLQQHLDSVTNTLATTAPQAITFADHLPATGTTTASLASQSFALLNQYLAGNSGRVDPGQVVAAVSQAAGWGQEAFLARPQH
jgi:hypothetical protein